MQLVTMAILGVFPKSEAGNSYILVVADYFISFTEALPHRVPRGDYHDKETP